MIASIHQPAYLPWMGYFDKIARADVFVYMDNVQYQKGSFQNRNKIRTKAGPIWLTVPVETSGKLFSTLLADITLNNRVDWSAKHASALRMNYGKAPNFPARWPEIETYYLSDWQRLSDLCWSMMQGFLRMLDIKTKVVKASELTGCTGHKSELVYSICKAVGADCYISGSQGRDYLDMAAFRSGGIDVYFQQYQHPVYKQQYVGFEPFMGIVDALFCDDDPARHFRGSHGIDGCLPA
ncbi:MAG: WbqC family protein [Ferrovibrio sp.]